MEFPGIPGAKQSKQHSGGSSTRIKLATAVLPVPRRWSASLSPAAIPTRITLQSAVQYT